MQYIINGQIYKFNDTTESSITEYFKKAVVNPYFLIFRDEIHEFDILNVETMRIINNNLGKVMDLQHDLVKATNTGSEIRLSELEITASFSDMVRQNPEFFDKVVKKFKIFEKK